MSNLARVGRSECCHKPPVKTAKAACRLRASPKVRESGFTLVEIVIAVAILLTIAAIAIPNYLAALDRAKVARAVGDIRTIGDAVLGYEVINQQFPDTLDRLGYGANLDPWGHPYQYLNFANVKGKGKMRKDRFLVPINSYFDLYSMGKDGQTVPPLTASTSKDDVIWANDGGFLGLASDY
ncbi:MAG: prepilin-type N-terminal cleavage/methylation domain-containing protein [Acidobacteriia bacterium]|nr:prepilin-type N-terminal cleavage/methylation domain-containing protein [Terriglobia bacterium]